MGQWYIDLSYLIPKGAWSQGKTRAILLLGNIEGHKNEQLRELVQFLKNHNQDIKGYKELINRNMWVCELIGRFSIRNPRLELVHGWNFQEQMRKFSQAQFNTCPSNSYRLLFMENRGMKMNNLPSINKWIHDLQYDLPRMRIIMKGSTWNRLIGGPCGQRILIQFYNGIEFLSNIRNYLWD